MSTIRRGLVSLFVSASFAALSGCGEGKPSVPTDTTTEATVKGTVRLNGKPATGGSIVFNPANFQRKDAPSRTASIKPDGSYEIKTLTGMNQVSVSGPEIIKEVPAIERQKFEYDVKPGDNTYDVEAKK